MSSRSFTVALASLGMFAAASAVLTQHWLFPLFSLNRDDSVYVAMAHLIAEHGAVTLPAADHEAFRPWASALVGDRIVLKYSPPWPSVLAAAEIVTGNTWISLGLTAAATAVLTSLLAVEVLHDRTAAVLAGVLLAVSPVFLVQSGTYLPYVFQLALGLGAAVLLLSGVRRRSTSRVVLAGVVMGIAFWARPFDALLMASPFVVHVLIQAWRDRRSRENGWSWWGCLLRLAAGGVPLLVVSMVYNAAVLGSPFLLPYMVTGPQDGFGFGQRGVFPEYASEFSLQDGLHGLLTNLRWLPSWTAGGIVLVVLAIVGLGRSTDPARWPVAAIAVVVPLAYLPFWGPHAIGDMWDGVQHFGPFYYLPILVPLVTFAAAALVAAARCTRAGTPRHSRFVIAATVAAMVLLTAAAVPDKVAANLSVKADFQALQQFIDQQQINAGVLLLPARGNLGFVSSSPFLQNDVSLDQPVLYAESRGPRDFDLIDRYPDRRLYRLTQELPPGRTTGGQLSMAVLHVESGPTITIRLRATNHTDHPLAIAYVHGVGEDRTHVLDQTSVKGKNYDMVWTFAAPAAGPTPPDVIRMPAGSNSGMLAVGLKVGKPGEVAGSLGSRWEQRMPYRVVAGGSRLELLRPGQAWSIEDTDLATWQPKATAAR